MSFRFTEATADQAGAQSHYAECDERPAQRQQRKRLLEASVRGDGAAKHLEQPETGEAEKQRSNGNE
ncbi:hypothetical protein D3C75_1289520 [compost metagenome]